MRGPADMIESFSVGDPFLKACGAIFDLSLVIASFTHVGTHGQAAYSTLRATPEQTVMHDGLRTTATLQDRTVEEH